MFKTSQNTKVSNNPHYEYSVVLHDDKEMREANCSGVGLSRPPCVLSALPPPCVLASCLQPEEGESWALKQIRIRLTPRAPTAWWRSGTILSSSLKGGERASEVLHVLAHGQVSMATKPQSNVKLTNWAQTEPSRPLCGPHHLHRSAAARLLAAGACDTEGRARAF